MTAVQHNDSRTVEEEKKRGNKAAREKEVIERCKIEKKKMKKGKKMKDSGRVIKNKNCDNDGYSKYNNNCIK